MWTERFNFKMNILNGWPVRIGSDDMYCFRFPMIPFSTQISFLVLPKKTPQTSALYPVHLFCYRTEDREVWDQHIHKFSDVSFLGLQIATLSLCPHMVLCPCLCIPGISLCFLSSFSHKGTSQTGFYSNDFILT